jgi:ubiquinone/menaquinone biosynthesis C-methylase UbiE
MANFNRIAGSYDFLKRLVFGKQLEKATNYFVKQIPSDSKILIIGGGSGIILRSFSPTHHIKYLELSEAMISKAKRINSKASVEFINEDVLEWKSNESFDFVITPFILDCFNPKQLGLIFPNVKKALKKEGYWIQTDFYPKNRFHKFLISVMYLFFKLLANLKVNELADFDLFFEKHKFILQRKALFYHSMVESKIYQQID